MHNSKKIEGEYTTLIISNKVLVLNNHLSICSSYTYISFNILSVGTYLFT